MSTWEKHAAPSDRELRVFHKRQIVQNHSQELILLDTLGIGNLRRCWRLSLTIATFELHYNDQNSIRLDILDYLGSFVSGGDCESLSML